MIERLNLSPFGKFKSADFPLKPVTLVWGPNEAGKTTFFDGLFQALCQPSETKVAGKLLKNRYGSARRASVEMSSSNLSASPLYSDDEFLNLFAIRAGDLQLDLNAGSDWMERLKSQLFHGGLDPKLLVGEFDKLASDKKNYVQNRKLDELRQNLARIGQDLEKKKQDRKSILQREKNLEKVNEELSILLTSKKAAEDRLHEFEKSWEREEKISARKKVGDKVRFIEDYLSLEKSWEELKKYHSVQPQNWFKIQDEIQAARMKIEIEKGKEELQSKQLEATQKELTSLIENGGDQNPKSENSSDSNSNSNSYSNQGQRKPAFPIRSATLLSAIILIASFGFGILKVQSSPMLAILSMLTGIICSGSLLVFTLRKKSQEKKSLEDSERQIKDKASRVLEINNRIQGLATQLSEIKNTLESANESEVKAKEKSQAWLDNLGANSGEEFLQKLASLEEIKTKRIKTKKVWEEMTLDLDADINDSFDPKEILRNLNRKLNYFDEQGIANRGLDEAALQRLKLDRQQALKKRDELHAQESKKLAEREGLAGEIRGLLGNLAADIVKGEDQVLRLELEIREKEMDKQAAQMAKEIFMTLGESSDKILVDLADEISLLLSKIFPEERKLILPKLDASKMQIPDSACAFRDLDFLSTGTRDCVVLAAKLSLALKANGGRTQTRGQPSLVLSTQPSGLLVLDDPFLALDEKREMQALNLLQFFHLQYGWQLILLTKEIRLRDRVKQIFPDAELIDLQNSR